MLVVDTSIWIEIYLETPLGVASAERLKSPNQIIVPTIVQYEIAKWMARERDEKVVAQVITFTSSFEVVDLSTALAVFASQLSVEHKLHATDAIIYATAQMYDAQLLTCDAHFEGLPGVEYSAKAE